MSTVSDLELKLRSLRAKIKETEESLERARQDSLGLHVGDIVYYKGEPHKIASFLSWLSEEEIVRLSKFPEYQKPWIRAYRKKKNGEWYENATNLYRGWEKVDVSNRTT